MEMLYDNFDLENPIINSRTHCVSKINQKEVIRWDLDWRRQFFKNGLKYLNIEDLLTL